MAHHVTRAQHLADGYRLLRVGSEHIEHARRHARTQGELGCSQRRQRGLLSGLDHHGAACGQRRGYLAGDHGNGEVPGRDGCAHPNGLPRDDVALVGVGGGDGLAVNPPGLFSKPLDKARAVDHFAPGLRQRLALFGRHDASQVVGVLMQQRKPLHQHGPPLLGGFGPPCAPGAIGCDDGLVGLLRAHIGHLSNHLARGRVGHRKAAVARDPFTANEAVGLQQAGIVKGGEHDSFRLGRSRGL